MAGKKSKSGKAKKGGRGLSPPDVALWKDMTRDVERLPGRDYEEPDAEIEMEMEPVKKESAGRVVIEPPRSKPRGTKGSEVDLRTAQRLARGQMKIDARLDLHGMGQAQALEALRYFIRARHERGDRCVLVITGKGGIDGSFGKPGVLKRKVPEWLREAPLAVMILKTAPARPNHGGDGAMYVLLRRQR